MSALSNRAHHRGPDAQIGWSEAEDAILRREHALGASFSEIAKKLPKRSRMSCIGRAQRLGLKAHDIPQAKRLTGPLKAPEVKGDKYAGNSLNARSGRPAPFKASDNGRVYEQPPSVALQIKAEAANDDAIPLMMRRRFQCAWPVGEPDRPANQMCCGQPVPENANTALASYCPRHAAKALSRDVARPKRTANELARSLRKYI